MGIQFNKHIFSYKRLFLTSIGVFVLFFSTKAQHVAPDTLKYLITNMELQYKITESLNALYNYELEKALKGFQELKTEYPMHPLPYFLIAYIYYWKIQPNEDVKLYDDTLLTYLDSTILMAERIYDKDRKNFEAIFFLTAGYSFKGRLLSDRASWARATFAGKRALDFLEKGRSYNQFSPEFLIGEGLFNYFAAWIPENYAAFKPIMWFFPKGDKQLGIQYLKEASQKAFYARIEAIYFLVRILIFDEQKTEEALPLADYLHKQYPDNPVFLRTYTRVLFGLGRYKECEMYSLKLLSRVDSAKQGYEAISGRYATFFLGWIYRNTNKALSARYFERSVDFSEKVGAVKMNYYLYSLSALADYAEELKDTEKAKLYHQKIKQNAGKRHDLYQKSKKFLREND